MAKSRRELLVALEDGSRCQNFPGDHNLTQGEARNRIAAMPSKNEIRSHALFGGGAKVRVIPAGESWPVAEVEAVLRKDS